MNKRIHSVLTNRATWILALQVGIVALSVSNSWAVGEQIESSLSKLLQWVTKVLGGAALGFGVVYVGIKMSLGDEQAMKKGGYICAGGIVIFSSTYIVQLIQSIFK